MLDRARDLLPRDAATLLTEIAATRAALGVVLLAAPRWSWRQLTRTPGSGDEAVLAVRMFGVRDLALGLGGLLAARRGAPVRGWAEAGVLCDAADAAALATTPAVGGWRRAAAAAGAGGTAVAGLVAAMLVSRS